jgi:hypothetical protein
MKQWGRHKRLEDIVTVTGEWEEHEYCENILGYESLD